MGYNGPDLNPFNFYFWGHMKAFVYKNVLDTAEDLWRRIFAAVNTIQADVGVCELVQKNWTHHSQVCAREL
jgi:hypothetical protein